MEIFISTIIDLIDKYYHQRSINKILLKLNLKIVLDVGAHKGEFLSSLLPAKKSIKIYEFEPQSEIFKGLKKRYKKSKNIFLYNKAISNKNKKKKLKINIKTSTSTFSEYNKNSYWKKIKSVLKKIINCS